MSKTLGSMTPQERIVDYIDRRESAGQEVRPLPIVQFLERNVPTRQERQSLLVWLTSAYPALAAEVRTLLPIAPTLVSTYTTAPVDYDGFGTETVAVVGTFDKKPLRHVETPVEHVEWQRMRYGSGLHCALDVEEFRKIQGLPWVVVGGGGDTGRVDVHPYPHISQEDV